jgi:hypothetical protein
LARIESGDFANAFAHLAFKKSGDELEMGEVKPEEQNYR